MEISPHTTRFVFNSYFSHLEPHKHKPASLSKHKPRSSAHTRFHFLAQSASLHDNHQKDQSTLKLMSLWTWPLFPSIWNASLVEV